MSIHVYGHVQGVGYRNHAQSLAKKLHLVGYARNEDDGSVHIEVQGNDARIQAFLAWCRKGPLFAHVERVETITLQPESFSSFEIF